MNKKILIADDHHVVFIGTSIIIEKNFENCSMDYAENYVELINKLSINKYDLIFLDINMPGNKGEIMISEIKKIQKDVKLLIFSTYDEKIAFQYIKNGADGYLNKLSDVSQIVAAVRMLFSEGVFFPSSITNMLLEASINNEPLNPFDKLSQNEIKVFNFLLKGYGNLEISNSLDIKMTTVSTYKKRIYKKLNVNNLADLIKVYQEYFRS